MTHVHYKHFVTVDFLLLLKEYDCKLTCTKCKLQMRNFTSNTRTQQNPVMTNKKLICSTCLCFWFCFLLTPNTETQSEQFLDDKVEHCQDGNGSQK